MIDSIIKTVNFYRNICAHEERLYNYKIKHPSKTSHIARALNINPELIKNGDQSRTY